MLMYSQIGVIVRNFILKTFIYTPENKKNVKYRGIEKKSI